MRFRVDENLPASIAEQIRQAGYDACTVGEQQLSGSPDATIAEVCADEQRALLTLYLDFANIKAFPPSEYPGIIVFRLARQDLPHIQAVVAQAVLPLIASEAPTGRLWIVEETRIRIYSG